MKIKRTRYDLTSADTKTVGTDFQFYYFINELLKLKKGQKLGYEVKDDVHIDLPCQKTVLIQNKHTTQKQANGQPINLTELDDDLLHTIDNWLLVICDKNDGRGTIKKQEEFAQNTIFLLATNKLIDNNAFISNINKCKDKKKNFDGFIKYLEKISKNITGEDSKKCIDNMLKMNRKVFGIFVSSLNIQVQVDNIIDEIRNSISDKYIRFEKINDVFSDIFFELKVRFFNTVNAGGKFTISYSEWHPLAITIFEKYQTTNLPIRIFEPAIPKYLEEQPFIEELLTIGDIEIDDLDEMAEYTGYMLEIEMNLKEWYDNSEITLQQRESFHKQAIIHWKNAHKKYHRNVQKNDYDCAQECLNFLREKELRFEQNDLNIELSNGEFYHLSNNRDIGWEKKWAVKYKK